VGTGRRKQLGAFYTPPALVDQIVQRCVGRGDRVLDPACGDGRFLRAARLAGAIDTVGVDVDETVGNDHDSTAYRLIVDDALTRDWSADGLFDAVVGNPPFLSQLSSLTSRGSASRWGGGPYADAAAEFLALAFDRVRPGGFVGFVLPQSLLGSRDAAAVRAAVDAIADLRWFWWTDEQIFDAASVRVCAAVWQRHPHDRVELGSANVAAAASSVDRHRTMTFAPTSTAPPPSTHSAGLHSWSWLLANTSQISVATSEGQPTLGDIATFTADFRDQYYGLVDAVFDDPEGRRPECPPLITSGLIDPGVCRWGEHGHTARFAKQRFQAARVDLAALSPKLQQWARNRLVPKVLIANQTKVVEAVHDVDGVWLPSVPVITCLTGQPQRVMATLADARTTAWLHQHAAGTGLSATAIRLRPALLAAVPLID
jgi:SAM-dependent methyltransferase